MTINLKDSLEIILALVAVISLVYRISKVEAAIYTAMDKIQDEIIEELRHLQRDYAVHISEYQGKKEWQQSINHQLNEKIDHKFNRLHQELKDMQRYLEKGGFKVRQWGQDDPNS